MNNLTIEIPFFTTTSGGIMRQTVLAQKFNRLWTIEIPKYTLTSGGIQQMHKLCFELKKKYTTHLRIQKTTDLDYSKINFQVHYSVGLPDASFPESSVVITYSDNPYTHLLTSLPQVKRVLIYMLSYGMCFERERKNILNPKVTVMSSTVRTQRMIEAEGIKCHRVGFGLENEEFYIDPSIQKKNYAALLYHYAPDKKYELGGEVCDELQKQGFIDGTITFGISQEYRSFKHPKSLVRHYENATRDQVRSIFNECKILVMPSITEGLNLTPVESTLCGCPAVICDGAIDDLFFDQKTCLIADKHSFADLFEKSRELLSNPIYSIVFKNNLESLLSSFTWDTTISNIEKLFE